MKNFKRIVSFVMAMVIFASFFCYNVGAVSERRVRYERSNRVVLEYFSNTSAYAVVRIRNWAEVDNSTDLVACTYAHLDDYNHLDNFYGIISWVNLEVWLEDGSRYQTDTFGETDYDGGTVDALANGSNCLNNDDHYSIEAFRTHHEVIIEYRYYDSFGNYISEYENDGPVIKIGTMYE